MTLTKKRESDRTGTFRKRRRPNSGMRPLENIRFHNPDRIIPGTRSNKNHLAASLVRARRIGLVVLYYVLTGPKTRMG